MIGIFRKLAASLRDHLGKGPSGIMLKMPFRRYDMCKKPVQFFRIVDQLCEKTAQIPAIQNIAYIKDDGVYFRNGRIFCHKQAVSPGAP